jgi:hypothetical protein
MRRRSAESVRLHSDQWLRDRRSPGPLRTAPLLVAAGRAGRFRANLNFATSGAPPGPACQPVRPYPAAAAGPTPSVTRTVRLNLCDSESAKARARAGGTRKAWPALSGPSLAACRTAAVRPPLSLPGCARLSHTSARRQSRWPGPSDVAVGPCARLAPGRPVTGRATGPT